MGLPDAVRVFPAHGAGSACGKNLSTERQSTIGEQRLTNYACRPMSEEDFVALVTAGQPAGPGVLRLRRRPQPQAARRSSTATRPAAPTGESWPAQRTAPWCSTPAIRRSSPPGTCAAP